MDELALVLSLALGPVGTVTAGTADSSLPETSKPVAEGSFGPPAVRDVRPRLQGAINPVSDPKQPFVSQPSGLPPDQRKRLLELSKEGQGRTWTLPQLIDEALRRNPATRVTWQEARSAAAQVGVAESDFWPTITASITGFAEDHTSAEFTGASPEYSVLGYTPQVQLQWLLFDFGAREANVESARFALLASNFAYNDSLQSVILGVMTNYYSLNGAKLQVQNAQVALKLSQKSLDSAEIKMKTGLGTSTAVYQAKQSLAQSRFNLQQAIGEMKEAQVHLSASIGLPGNADLSVSRPSQEVDLNVLKQRVDNLVDLALRQRPDLAEAYANWQSKRQTARAADAAIWPTIGLQFNFKEDFFDADIEQLGQTFREGGQDRDIQGLLTFSWEIFDGFENVSEARSARALAASAQAELANTELQAIAEVVISYVSLESAYKQVQAAEALVESSKQSYQATSIGYRSGLNNILDLLTAENNFASAEASLAGALTDLYTSAAELSDATGSLLPLQNGGRGFFARDEVWTDEK